MIDLDVLKAHGITEDSLRQRLAGNPLEWGNIQYPPAGNPPTPVIPFADGESDAEKVGRLLHRIRSRIQEGMNRNYKDYTIYYAIDTAWDTPFRQVSPTLLGRLMNPDAKEEDVYSAAQQWGLTNMVTKEKDPKSGKEHTKINLPTFFELLVPLVRAYVTIRWAKIVNDRRLTPFLKYEPVKLTTPLSLKCDAITDRVEIMARQYGYFDTMKQAVLKMLMYGRAFAFPKEEWHYEEQIKEADEVDVALKKKKPNPTAPDEPEKDVIVDAGDEIKYVTREGLRYHIPHPTRTYWDLADGAHTFNSDSGCQYAGYWKICRYREIRDGNYWNKDRIALGTMDIMANNRLFFTSVYSACTLKMGMVPPPNPKVPDGSVLAASVGVGAGNLDREKEIANLYYGTDHGDQGVLVTEHWEKVNPKQDGLGDYDGWVWFRFVVAGDGCTVLYAAPVPYNPVLYWGYDADESRSMNASLALETLPFQDMFSNVLTQVILTAKQNLANITFVDLDQLPEGTKQKIENLGEGYYRFLNTFGYSSRSAARGLNRIAETVQTAALPKGNTAELINVLREILNILERVLVMSSQEVAQAASHELRVDEVRNIAQSTSSRLQFTATPVDIARDSWKRQLYQGLMAYGDEDFYVHIPSETPLDDKTLEAMGFTFTDKPIVPPPSGGPETAATVQPQNLDRYRRATIKKGRTAVPLWEFASVRDGDDRMDNAKVGAVMVQLMQGLLANPMTAAAVGPDQALDIANRIAKFLGMPMDFKLRNVNPQASPEQQQQEQAQMMQQLSDAVMQRVHQELQGELKPLLDHEKDQDTVLQKVQGIMEVITKALQLQLPALNDQNNAAPAIPGNGPGNPAMANAPGM